VREPSSVSRLLLIALWTGLVYGVTEGLIYIVFSFVPGALAWRSGNSPRILWVAPLVYVPVFFAVALIAAVIGRAVRRLDVESGLFFTLVVIAGFLAAMLQGQLLSPLASVLLALGVAVQAFRWFRRRRAAWMGFMRATTPVLVGAVALSACAEVGLTRVAETRAVGNLSAARHDAPNVLLLVLDTLRADHLSGYGYPRNTTPRLDEFARQGVLFERAYANSSWTLPSHASIMTGRFVHEHQAGNKGRPYLDGRFPTLAEVLSRQGYATGGFVANTFWCGRQTGLDRGFARYDDFFDNAGDAFARTVLGRLLAYDVLPSLGLIDIPGRRRAEAINEDVLRWIDARGDRPFFAFVNYLDVHGPYLPPPSFAGRFGATAGETGRGEIELGAIREDTAVPAPQILQAWKDRYDESLSYLDAKIGELFDALAARGLLDKTIVIVTSDHGESWGEHAFVYHGHSLYLHQVRVPLIIRAPGITHAGVRENSPVGLERIPTTIAHTLGISSPFPGPPLLDVGDGGARAAALAEVGQRNGVPRSWPTASGWLRAVMTDRWQFILGQDGRMELYDLQADPGQQHDLSRARDLSPVTHQLRAELDRLVSGTHRVAENVP
jgi:arylsulfatase A-like enzyme